MNEWLAGGFLGSLRVETKISQIIELLEATCILLV